MGIQDYRDMIRNVQEAQRILREAGVIGTYHDNEIAQIVVNLGIIEKELEMMMKKLPVIEDDDGYEWDDETATLKEIRYHEY
jgi:hypothetical protein